MNITQEDVKVFLGACKVTEIVYEYASPKIGSIIYMEDRRDNDVIPCQVQTKGLFLELYNGHPARIFTPWGVWPFAGLCLGEWGDVLSLLLNRLGAKQVREKKGDKGPLYAIYKIDQKKLPEPKLLENFNRDFNLLIEQWRYLRRTFLFI